MGKLLKEIQTPLPSRARRIEQIVKELGEDGPDLLKALNDPDIRSTQIHRALLNRGILVGYSTIQLWRRAHGIV